MLITGFLRSNSLLFFRGGKYSEGDAKAVMVQILNVVAFCHLQGVVHRDLKPEVVIFVISENIELCVFSLMNVAYFLGSAKKR